jgi:hypothetical protein
MFMRVPDAACVDVFVGKQVGPPPMALFDATKFPQRHRRAPRHQKDADDHVADDAEIERTDEIEERAFELERAPDTCSNSIVPMTSATAIDNSVVVML